MTLTDHSPPATNSQRHKWTGCLLVVGVSVECCSTGSAQFTILKLHVVRSVKWTAD